jgi:hypothetical protein
MSVHNSSVEFQWEICEDKKLHYQLLVILLLSLVLIYIFDSFKSTDDTCTNTILHRHINVCLVNLHHTIQGMLNQYGPIHNLFHTPKNKFQSSI